MTRRRCRVVSGARSRSVLLVAFLSAIGVQPVHSQPAPAPAPGAAGYLLTALEGTRIERVPVVYVGVLEGALGLEFDLHLIALQGPVGDEIGIASGMSGSPVYFDDRPFGALSYRLGAFPRRAIGGVTRLEDMERAVLAGRPDGAGPRPIATPVHLGGVPLSIRAWATGELADLDLVATSGGGRLRGASVPTLVAGSPVGVELVRGDLRIAATGTVTAVDGDRVLAFGHPFLGSGSAQAPMVVAEIVHTLADAAGSSKLANTGAEVGAITDDRLTAVVGRLGARATMLPVTVRVQGPNEVRHEHAYEVVDDSPLTPVLVAVSVASALTGAIESEAEGTMIAHGAIRLRTLSDVPLDFAYSSANGGPPAIELAGELQRILQVLLRTGLGEVAVEGIDLVVDVVATPVAYTLEELLFDRGPVPPGSTLRVTAVLAAHGGAHVRRTLEVPIPEGIAPGTPLALAVGSPRDLDTVSGRPRAGRLASASDLPSLVGVLGDSRGGHRLTAAVYRADAGLVVDGARYSELPPSARGLVTSNSARRDLRMLRVASLSTVEITLDGPVVGGLSAALVSGYPRPEGQER